MKRMVLLSLCLGLSALIPAGPAVARGAEGPSLPAEVQELLQQGKRMEAVERMIGLLVEACKGADYKKCSEAARALAELAKEQDLLEWTARKLEGLKDGRKERNLAACVGLFFVYREMGKFPEAWHNLSLAVWVGGWDPEEVILPRYRQLLSEKRYAEAGLAAFERFKVTQNYAHLAEMDVAYNAAKRAGPEELGRLVEWLKTACNLSIDDIGAKFTLILLKVKAGAEKEAARELAEFIRDYPRFAPAIRVAVDVYESINRPDRAAKFARAALAIDPRDYPLRLRYARLLLKAGRIEEAERAFREAFKLAPNPAAREEAWRGLYDALFLQGRADELLEEAKKYADSDDPYKLLLYADALAWLGKRSEALEAFRKVLERAGSDEVLVQRCAGTVEKFVGPGEALPFYGKLYALRKARGYAVEPILDKMVEAALKGGRAEELEKFLQAEAKEVPGASQRLVLLLASQGRAGEAASRIVEAARSPDDLVNLTNRAFDYLIKAGKAREAVALLDAVARGAGDPWAAGRVLVPAVNTADRVLKNRDLARELAVQAAACFAQAASTKPPDIAAQAAEQLLALQVRFIKPRPDELRLSLRRAEAVFDAAAKATGDYLKAGQRIGRLADIAGFVLRDQAERNRLDLKAANYFEMAFRTEKDIDRRLAAKEQKVRRAYRQRLKEAEVARRALAEVEAALRVAPPDYKGRPLLSLHNMAGDMARQALKDYARAIAHYNAVIKTAPKESPERWAAYRGLALCYIEMGNSGAAIEAVRGLAAEIDPRNNWAGRMLYEVADAAIKQGLRNVAVEALGAIVKRFWGTGGEGIRLKARARRRYHRLVNPNEPPPGLLPPPDYAPRPPSPDAVPAPISVALDRVATYEVKGVGLAPGAQAVVTDSVRVSISASDPSAEGMMLLLAVWSPRGFKGLPKGAKKDPEGDVARMGLKLSTKSPFEAEFVLSRAGTRFSIQGWSIARAFQPTPTGRVRVAVTIKAPVPVEVAFVESGGCAIHEDTFSPGALREGKRISVLGPGGSRLLDCRNGLTVTFEVSPPQGARGFLPRVEVLAAQGVKAPTTGGGTNWVGLRAWPDFALSLRTPGWFKVEEAAARGVLKIVLPEMVVR